jgi:glycosyltransferase involved in cell wall biosynthesis
MMDPLRVGILTYGLDRSLTGIGRYTLELLNAMEKQDGLSQLVLLTSGKLKNTIYGSRIKQLPLSRSGRLPILLILGTLLIRQVSQKHDLQIVHDPTGNAPFAFGCGSASSVVTVHDVYAFLFPRSCTMLEKFITRLWLPFVMPKVDAIITDSQNSKGDIIRYLPLPENKIHVVPIGVSSSFNSLGKQQVLSVLARYNLNLGYTLTLSTLKPRRNLRRLLQAYSKLGEERSLPPLTVIGKVTASEIAKLSISGFERCTRWLDYVPESDLPALFCGAGMFVFPSLYEGFGLPPLEAMACGVPVACSNASSLPEVVGDAGMMFDPYDIYSIASAVANLLDSPDLRDKLREAGLRRASKFTWQRTAQATLSVYQSVLENTRVS